MDHFDIAINITLHNEGYLLFKTFKSIGCNIDFLKKDHPKARVAVNVLLDNPDAETARFIKKSRDFIKKYADKYSEYIESLGDVGLSRNYLIDKALKDDIKYIAIYDGDDLYSRRYLSRMYSTAIKFKKPAVVAYEFLLDLDEWTGLLYTRIHKLWSSFDKRQPLTNMYSTNLYSSQILVDKRIFEKIKYQPNLKQYRYEDYKFTLDALANGYPIVVAPKTMHIYRRKLHGSVLATHSQSSTCLAPTKLFSPDIFSKLSHIEADDFDLNKYNYWAINPKRQLSPDGFYLKLHKSHIRNSLLYTKRAIKEVIKSGLNFAVRIKNSICKNEIDYDIKQANLDRLKKAGFDQEMLDDIKFLNKIEPLAIYDDDHFINFTAVTPLANPNPVDDIYYNLCSKKGMKDVTDILLVPHITLGGADKAMIHLCQTLSNNGRNVLVIATNSGDENPWGYKVSNIKNATFLERDTDFPIDKINDKDLEIMLLRVIQNWPKIKSLTVMNSGVGYNLIDNWHKEIKKRAKIYVHSWAFSVNQYGMNCQPFMLQPIYEYIDHLIIDGDNYKKQLVAINGWNGDKIEAVSLPISPVNLKKDYQIKKKVFYAGRFSVDKRIDLILDICQNLAKDNIQVDFYGTPDQTDHSYSGVDDITRINALPNTFYKGGFNGFKEIPVDDYDIFILPTKSEGMPNIVLESLKANVFVVAGDAGSINSRVKDYKNGFVVKDNASSDAYEKAIRQFYDQQDKILDPKVRKKFNDKILESHKIKNYEEAITNLYD